MRKQKLLNLWMNWRKEMGKCFNGLSVVNLELTSRCNKNCWMCGRRKLEKLKKTDWGDIDFKLVKSIAKQLPEGILIHFHSNGEPLLYPRFGEAIKMFKNQIKTTDTNGKLLLDKICEVINNLDTLTISVIEDDPEGDEQYEIVKKFLEIKGDKKPFMIYRLLGEINEKERWYDLPGIVCTRILHNPMGSFDYTKKVTIPEHGICLDLLTHLVIDRYGDCYPCVRFNPNKYNKLGNIEYSKLIDIWNHPLRKYFVEEHIKGNRNCSDLCSECDFYGVPTSY